MHVIVAASRQALRFTARSRKDRARAKVEKQEKTTLLEAAANAVNPEPEEARDSDVKRFTLVIT